MINTVHAEGTRTEYVNIMAHGYSVHRQTLFFLTGPLSKQ